MVVATFLAFLAMLLAYLALLKILLFKPFIPHDEPCCGGPQMVPVMEAPMMEAQPYYDPVPIMPAFASPMMPYTPMLPAY